VSGGPGDFESAPSQEYPWLRTLLPKRLHPWARGVRKRWQLRRLRLEEPYASIYSYTQVSLSRQQNLRRMAALIDADGIPGAALECGVLDGGTAALIASSTAAPRPIHLFDAWQGLPQSTAEDGLDAAKWVGDVVGSPRRVNEILARLRVDPARVHIHRGWFHETFPRARREIGQVALLHVDCDFYEPTRLCLDTWLPVLAPGGFVQIDDYASFQGCRQAVDECLARVRGVTLERFGDQGAAYFFRWPR
jgi:O-methyltransferase